jgi:hypothetical protein
VDGGELSCGDGQRCVSGAGQPAGRWLPGGWLLGRRCTHCRASELQREADVIDKARKTSGWQGLYFGGTAFKKQREVDPANYQLAARKACAHMDVITTSGVATGHEADLSKIEAFRAGIGERPLALASGITPDNAHAYADVDCFMVATGINHEGNFYDIDPARLNRLMRITRKLGGGTPS